MPIQQLSGPGRRGRGVVYATLMAVALGALAPAAADAGPARITKRPVVVGTPQVGALLEAQGAEWDGDPEPVVSWQWLRCDGSGADTRSCREIVGATNTTYTVQAADLGKRLRALLTVRNEDGSASALTSSTAAVTAGPAPAPVPVPAPEPAPSPAPAAPAPVPVPAGDSREEQATRPARMMKPAPIVRVRGRLTRSGARITLLTVRAPRGARIVLRCAGRGCPAKRWARIASLVRILRFEVALRAGTRVVIDVTKPGRIGKRTTIVIRRGEAPRRVDRCVTPGGSETIRCPRG